MNKDINIIKLLSKDDKEVIHSAIISFLLNESKFFREKILGVGFEDIEIPKEEVSYPFRPDEGSRRRIRFDILVTDKAGERICIIENKFKSLPTRIQFRGYSRFAEQKFKGKDVSKVLISFLSPAKGVLPADWRSITYAQIHDWIQEFMERKPELSQNKRFLVEQYQELLQEKLTAYQEAKTTRIYEIFSNPGDNKGENRFWLTLFLSEILSEMEEYQEYFSGFYLGGGSSNIPLLNLHPRKSWKDYEAESEFLIQLQGGTIKLYCHIGRGMNGNAIVGEKIQSLQKNGLETKSSGEFKDTKETAREERTKYVYRENLLKEIGEESFSIERIKEYLLDFYHRVNKANEPKHLKKEDDILNSEGTILGLYSCGTKHYLSSHLNDGSGTLYYRTNWDLLKKYMGSEILLKELFLKSDKFSFKPRQGKVISEIDKEDYCNLIQCGESYYSELSDGLKNKEFEKSFYAC